jgi:hypothetical protein
MTELMQLPASLTPTKENADGIPLSDACAGRAFRSCLGGRQLKAK